MKGALKFVSEDQEMQMLIFKSEELEIINPCSFKIIQNQNNNQISNDLMKLFENTKSVKNLVNTFYNKLFASI